MMLPQAGRMAANPRQAVETRVLERFAPAPAIRNAVAACVACTAAM